MLGGRRPPRKGADQRRSFLVRQAALRHTPRFGNRQFVARQPSSEAQHSEHEKKHHGDDGGDQQRAETAQSVGKEKEHGGPTGRTSVVDQRPDQREQGLVFGSVAARPKELSDLGHGRLSA